MIAWSPPSAIGANPRSRSAAVARSMRSRISAPEAAGTSPASKRLDGATSTPVSLQKFEDSQR